MENASKALIIAGAILISILLISVGIMIIGSTDGITEGMTSEMSATEITAFNSKFTKYEGKQSATNVKNLIRDISTSNTVNEATSDDDHKHIKLTLGTEGSLFGADVNNATKAIKSTQKYEVVCTVDTTSGLVTEVKITGTFNDTKDIGLK